MKLPRLAVAPLAVVMTVGVAACGSSSNNNSSTTSSSGSSSASAGQVANVKKKTVGFISLAKAAPIEGRIAEAMVAGGKALGWEVKVTDAGGEPSKVVAAVQAYANEHVDALVLSSIGVEGAQRAVQQLQAAKTPIIQIGGQIPASSVYAAQYSENERKLGEVLAKDIVSSNPSGAKVGDITLSVAYATKERDVALKQVIAATGGKSAISASASFNLANPVVSTQETVANMLTADPSINAVFGVSDITVQPSISAILKRKSSAKVYSFYSDPTSLESLRKKQPIAAVADLNLPVSALVALDQLVGYFQKGTPINREALSPSLLEYKIVDQQNVPPAGKEVYPLATTLKPYAEKWAREYPLS
ncbi:MAG: hypothetical protein JWN10_1543 [Solirubrobacterales bacterium]|nr:hypothetical protein [Solirubrobacterales bacterium]